LSRKHKPRDAAEAREWLTRLVTNLRDVQAKPDEVPLNSDLAAWFADAVEAYTLKRPTKASMDVELGLKPRPGRRKGTDMGGTRTAIDVHHRLLRDETWGGISEHLGIGVRSLQRTYKTHTDKIVEHLLHRGARSVPLGYDLKDGKLVVNKSEAATIRMIFERYAQLGSAPAPKRAFTKLVCELNAEGITDKRGKPIDIYKVINNPVYIGETMPKGMYSGKHKAIVGRALWNKVHRIRRVLMATRRRRGR
jgi:hypothetical protein